MGNSNSQTANSELYSVLKPMKWQKEHWLSNTELVRDMETNLKGELHSLPIENIQPEIVIYQFRKDNPQYLVTVYSVEKSTEQILCAGGDFVKVVTQRIPFRLTDLGNIGYAEGLYILECVLKGAQLIDQRYLSCKGPKLEQCSQYVHYTDQMVCFTETGQAKIWVSQNLASNHPTEIPFQSLPQQNILETFNIQKKIVYQLFNLIESRMSGNKFQNYLQVKKQQEEDLIDFENCIDFILRMRAIEEGEDGQLKNIILPSMIVKSMPTPTQYQTYTNRTENNDNNDQNSSNAGQKMNNSVTDRSVSSTTSLYNQDINKFALPPRPPRKNSKSASKQKPYRNTSQSKPIPKPEIQEQKPIVQPTFQKHQNPQATITLTSSPRSLTNIIKKQSINSNARSPFKQMSQPTWTPTHIPAQPKQIVDPPSITNNSPQLSKKNSNNNNNNTNTTMGPALFHPIESETKPKLTAQLTTHNSPPHSNKPYITFNNNSMNSNINTQPNIYTYNTNTSTNTQPSYKMNQYSYPNTTTPTLNNNNNKFEPSNTLAPSVGEPILKTSPILKKQNSQSTTQNISDTFTNKNDLTVGDLHRNYNTKYGTTFTPIPAPTPTQTPTLTPTQIHTQTPTQIPHNYYPNINNNIGQYQPYPYRNDNHMAINNKINITFNGNTMPVSTPRNIPTPTFYPDHYTSQPYPTQQFNPITNTYPITTTYPINPNVASDTNTGAKLKEYSTLNKKQSSSYNVNGVTYNIQTQPANISPALNNPITTTTNVNEKNGLKVSSTNIETTPKISLSQNSNKFQSQFNKNIEQRVHNVLNRQLLADALLSYNTKTETRTNLKVPTNQNTSPHKNSTSINTATSASTNRANMSTSINVNNNSVSLVKSKATSSEVEGSIEEI